MSTSPATYDEVDSPEEKKASAFFLDKDVDDFPSTPVRYTEEDLPSVGTLRLESA